MGGEQGIQGLGVTAEGPSVAVQAEVLNVLVGIVQHGVEVTAKVRQVVVDGLQGPLQGAAHLPGGIGGGIGGFCFNEVNDGLRLGQVQLAV